MNFKIRGMMKEQPASERQPEYDSKGKSDLICFFDADGRIWRCSDRGEKGVWWDVNDVSLNRADKRILHLRDFGDIVVFDIKTGSCREVGDGIKTLVCQKEEL